MKRKSGRALSGLLNVVLLFSGVLVSAHAVADETEGRPAELLSHAEIVAPQSDDASRPWRLKWASTDTTYNEAQLFIAVHERAATIESADLGQVGRNRQSRAAIYLVVGDRFKSLRQLQTPELEISRFLKPTVVWTGLHGKKGEREQLVQITELFYGTGGFRTEHVFRTVVVPVWPTVVGKTSSLSRINIEPVELIPADKSFSPHFAKGEGNWKGVMTSLGSGALTFRFFIWRDGDGNCCPNRG